MVNGLNSLYEKLNLTWLEKGPGYQMKSRAIFMLILHKLICHTNCIMDTANNDPRITKVKEYILSNYHRKIETEELAELTGLHPVYLGALFKKVMNCTVKQYINRIRINTAENLLSTGGYTVSEAAVRCGFDDVFYFSKLFKKDRGYPSSLILRGKLICKNIRANSLCIF